MKKVFTTFYERDPQFLEKFAALPKHGTKRRYLARTQAELYPHRPDFADEHPYELTKGWWLCIHLSSKGIMKLIKMACEVARVQYGKDLVVSLGV
jgi:hypothetical protein